MSIESTAEFSIIQILWDDSLTLFQAESINADWEIMVPVMDNGLFAISKIAPNLPVHMVETHQFYEMIEALQV